MKKLTLALAFVCSMVGWAQPSFTLRADKADRQVSPTLYGLMTEEINFSYEGGLYSQLLRDAVMREVKVEGGQRRGNGQRQRPTQKPMYWLLSDTINGEAKISSQAGINYDIKTSLSLNLKQGGISVVNPGFWGVAVHPSTQYTGSFYMKGNGKMTVGVRSTDGKKVFMQKEMTANASNWKKYEFAFETTAEVTPTKDAEFFITFANAGEYSLGYATLFPKSKVQHSVKSDMFRTDIMDMLREMKPTFLRFPGGNYLEGNRFSERFDWKRTLGPIETRPGHRSPWNYWSTDGMGLLEFLCWAEECKAEPVLGVFAGYVLSGDYVEGEALEPFIQDALDEIEYVMGDTSTKWGAQRAKDGHPAPFPLHYVEIGNEDFFDRSGSYPGRYMQFYNAIKAKYPQLLLISTVDEKAMRQQARNPEELKLELIDEHYYRSTEGMYKAAQQYDSYDRNGVKIFCGEWAAREGDPTTNMNAALGDAAWMTCMERNSDIVVMQCYAPLLVNVNEGGMQWKSDLIGYDALNSFGSPSYYAQCMFAQNVGDRVVPVEAANIPDMKEGQSTVPQLYYVATRDSKTGAMYLKVVNGGATAQKVNVNVVGAKVKSSAKKTVLKANKPQDTNSIDNPKNIVPVKGKQKAGSKFTLNLDPYSITVIEM